MADRSKRLPTLPSSWDPPVAGLTRILQCNPAVMEELSDGQGGVDQVKGFLIEVETQESIMDQIDHEACRNGLLPARTETGLLSSPSSALTTPATAPNRGDSVGSAGAEIDAASPSTSPPAWQDAVKRTLESAANKALHQRTTTATAGLDSPRVTPRGGRATGRSWHQCRRESMLRDVPELATFVHAKKHFFLSVIIGLLAVLLHVYMIHWYVPRVYLQFMVSPSNEHKPAMLVVHGANLLRDQSWYYAVVAAMENSVATVSPFSAFSSWVDANVADIKPLRFFLMVCHFMVLAYTWGWWLSFTAHTMACEVAAETVGSFLAVERQPSVSAWRQEARTWCKRAVLQLLHLTHFTSYHFEYAALGHRGHLEHLGRGEISLLQFRFVMGTPATNLDGGLLLPQHLFLKQRRWSAMLVDRFGVSIRDFPEAAIRRCRAVMLHNQVELLREEHRLTANNGEKLGDRRLLNSKTVNGELAATRPDGSRVDPSQFVILFAKQHYYRFRRVSTKDFEEFCFRFNCSALDPRGVQALEEFDHPLLPPTRFQEIGFRLGLFWRDVLLLVRLLWFHWGFTILPSLAGFVLATAISTFLAALRWVPGFSLCCSPALKLLTAWYKRDNDGMFLSRNGLELFLRRFWFFSAQGLHFVLSGVLFVTLVWWPTYALFSLYAYPMRDLGYYAYTYATAITATSVVYLILCEVFAMGLLWHPIWFVHAVGHLATSQASGEENTTTAADGGAQASYSIRSSWLTVLTWGTNLHTEQHDIPWLPWVYRRHLPSLAPEYYRNLVAYDGWWNAVRAYRANALDGCYSPMC